jgi:hypothetical protein
METSTIDIETAVAQGASSNLLGSLSAAVLARQSWTGLPVLRRIISTPVLRLDGTLLQTPGYDPATGFFLASSRPIEPIPEQPSPAEVARSREFLLDRFLRDFPWRSPAGRANYLAMLVSPIIRPYARPRRATHEPAARDPARCRMRVSTPSKILVRPNE